MASARTGFSISNSFFIEIEDFIKNLAMTENELNFGIDALCSLYAHTTVGFAQKYSLGPVDPRAKNKEAAWVLPVRRITENYLKGWKVQQLTLGAWMALNDSREAYYIEFGINHQGTGKYGPHGQRVRIRRPILKLSIMKAMEFAAAAGADVRMIAGMLNGYYYSPALTEVASHGAGRSYPVDFGALGWQ